MSLNLLKQIHDLKVKSFLILIFSGFILQSCSTGLEKSDDFSFNIFPEKINGKYSYRTSEGEKYDLIPSYDFVSFFKDGLAYGLKSDSASENWKNDNGKEAYQVEFINKNGEILFNGFLESFEIGEEAIWIVEPGKSPSAISREGERLFNTSPNVSLVKPFSDGLSAFKVISNGINDKSWGFMDIKGDVIIEPQFFSLDNGDFSDGLCIVTDENGKCGAINKEGILTIPYKFDYLGSFIDGNAVFGKFDDQLLTWEFGLINSDGLFSLAPNYDRMSRDGDYFLVSKKDDYGWVNAKGEIIIPLQFDNAHKFNGSNYAPVEISGKWGFIDKNGKIVVDPTYHSVSSFRNGLALIHDDGLAGLINEDLEVILLPQFDVPVYQLREFSPGTRLAVARAGTGQLNKYGFQPENDDSDLLGEGLKSDYFNSEEVLDVINNDIYGLDSLYGKSYDNIIEDISNKSDLVVSRINKIPPNINTPPYSGNFFNWITEYKRTNYLKSKIDVSHDGVPNNLTFRIGLFGNPTEMITEMQGQGFYRKEITYPVLNLNNKPNSIIYEFKTYEEYYDSDWKYEISQMTKTLSLYIEEELRVNENHEGDSDFKEIDPLNLKGTPFYKSFTYTNVNYELFSSTERKSLFLLVNR